MLRDEEFLARLQKGSRIQVPVLIRWKHKLDAGEVLRIRVWSSEAHSGEYFYARLGGDGRFTLPKIVVEELELEPGHVYDCTLCSETAEGRIEKVSASCSLDLNFLQRSPAEALSLLNQWIAAFL